MMMMMMMMILGLGICKKLGLSKQLGTVDPPPHSSNL